MAATRKTPTAQPKGDYEVGYGKPPKHSQFKPGNAANPRGRPRGSKNRMPALHEQRFHEFIQSEAYRPITVNDNGRSVTMPVAQAFVRTLGMSALKGHARAQKLFAELLARTERNNKALNDRYLENAIEYKFKMRRELDHCREHGLPPPEILPHPDDIVINMAEGTVDMRGPMTPEQFEAWEELACIRDKALAVIKWCTAELETEKNGKRGASLKATVDHMEVELAKATEAIGDWPNHQRP